MLIGFFVNDLEREYENYTTTVLAHQAASRGHRVCYITPSDFVLNPDDTLSVHGRFLPKRKYKDRGRALRDPEGSQGDQDRAGRRHRDRRADAAQRPVDRRPDAVGDGGRDPVRARGGEARGDRPQRSRQPRPGDQQALFPGLPGRGARRDADHQARLRHQGVRQGAWQQHRPEAAPGLGRVGRVQARPEERRQPQPDDRGDRPRRLHHRPGLCARRRRRATSACS